MKVDETAPREPVLPVGVLKIRAGPGANCSSIGSAVDILFAAAVAGGVVFVVASALVKLGVASPSKRGPGSNDGEKGDDAP